MRLKSRLLFSNTVIPQNKDVKFGILTLQFYLFGQHKIVVSDHESVNNLSYPWI